ncbi:lysophospholipid acyltransferase family protein [Ekhidna sp.]|uniref:lysophospholipid acyltransferase family protein n=1 Tax=Ekhidna sp. TaxID=2608089 RepID=UPI003298554F
MQKHQTTGLSKFLNRCLLVYIGVIFFLLFFSLLPIFFLAVLFKKKRFGLILTKYWTTMFYFLIGIKIVVENEHLLDKKSTYIFCPNHFSYLDIPIMTQVPVAVQFVGKESLSKIPGFGYYFRKFHIMVDRESLRSSYAAFKESITSLQKNFSLTVFPEGGINVGDTTELSEFKEGPFKMALKTGVHLVPITLADNWHILPDDGSFLIKWKRKSRVIIHEPIDPSKYQTETLKEFQMEVRNTIQTELNVRNAVR